MKKKKSKFMLGDKVQMFKPVMNGGKYGPSDEVENNIGEVYYIEEEIGKEQYLRVEYSDGSLSYGYAKWFKKVEEK